MARTLQIKRGAKSTMPTLAQGELGFVTDSGAEELHVGTGSENIQIARQDYVDDVAIASMLGTGASRTGSLKWDGIIGDRKYVMDDNDNFCVYVSDEIPVIREDVPFATLAISSINFFSETPGYIVNGCDALIEALSDDGLYAFIANSYAYAYIVPLDNYVYNSITFPKKGVYFYSANYTSIGFDMDTPFIYVSSLAITGYSFKEVDLDPYATIEQMETSLAGKSDIDHTHSWDDIENKPVVTDGGDTLTWDGNIDGLVSVSGVIFKVSDATPALSDFSNGGYGYVNGEFSEFSADDIIEDQGAITIGTIAFIIHAEEVGVEIGGIVFPEPGTYFSYIPDQFVISSLTIPGYTGFAQEKIAPSHLYQPDWNQTDTSAADYVKNKPDIEALETSLAGKSDEGHTHTASEVGAFPIEGGTITGQNIYLNNGTGRLMNDGEQTRLEAWNTAGDDTTRRVLTLYDGEAMDNIAGAFTITDRKDSANTEYKIYGEHNKPKPSDIGAVSKTGDFMTGNLHIQDTTNNAESFFQHYNHRTIVAARNSINDGANERMIQLSDSTITESLGGAVQLVDTVDGTKAYYNIIHEGNKELIKPADIGAAEEEHTHTATEVGALPIEGGTITGTNICLNNGTGRLMANGDAAQIEAWTTAGDDSERRILTMYDKGAKSDVASSLVLTDRVGSINTEYKIYGEHNKPTLADVGGAVTKTFGASNSAAIYVKISDFGAWGTGTWYQKGFSMLISSRAGETVWLSVSADDSNTNAKAFRLMNTYSKIVAVYYSASESAVYVKANAWCNNICAHILSNVYGDYVPTVAQASALASDAVEVKITEFGPAYDHVAVGRSDQPIKLKGSSDRPLYNDNEIALKSDLDALLASAITVHSGTVEPTSNMGSDGDLYVYTGG